MTVRLTILGCGSSGGVPRIGVDMVWGAPVVYGHIGIDLTGPTGGEGRASWAGRPPWHPSPGPTTAGP